jgi:hypothetical protein
MGIDVDDLCDRTRSAAAPELLRIRGSLLNIARLERLATRRPGDQATRRAEQRELLLDAHQRLVQQIAEPRARYLAESDAPLSRFADDLDTAWQRAVGELRDASIEVD